MRGEHEQMSEETRSGATAPRRVVVTGAAGYIAGLLLPGLRRRYELTLLDVRNEDRQVVISSNHAADYYEPLILDRDWDVVTPDMQERAVGYYGWAKACYEHLGFIFAQGPDGEAPVENVQIRIGGPREIDVERAELGDMRRVRRALAVYISQRDLVQLVVKSIETPDIRTRTHTPPGTACRSRCSTASATTRKRSGALPTRAA